MMVFEVTPMAAYIDISAVSIAIPAIAGVVIAVSSAIYIRWRKVKHKVSNKLGIDENAGKEVEDDFVIKEDEFGADEKDKKQDK